MRFLRLLLPPAAVFLLCLVPAANALTITAAAPAEPLPSDGTVTIDVQVDTSCQEIVQDQVETQPLIAASSVDWITAAGGTLAWTQDQCDPNSVSNAPTCTPQPDCVDDYPTATTSGTITLTPTAIAPALETADISIKVGDKEATFTFPVTVAHYAQFAASADRTTVKAGLAEKQPLNVTLDVTTNAVSTVTFNVTQAPTHGTLRGLDNVPISPNVAQLFEHHAGFFVWSDGGPDAGKPVSLTVPLQFESGAAIWTSDQVTVEVRMFADKDPSLMSEPVTLSWTFEPTVTQEPKGESPGPDLLVVALTLAVLAFARTRRKK